MHLFDTSEKLLFFEPSAAQSAPNEKCPKPHINERFRAFFCVKNHTHARLFTEFMSNTGARYVCNRLRQRHEYFIYLSFIHLSASCMFFWKRISQSNIGSLFCLIRCSVIFLIVFCSILFVRCSIILLVCIFCFFDFGTQLFYSFIAI